MNKKGFTLVEILAVIVLIVVISLLVFPSILNSIKSSQDEIDEATKLLLINAAKLYVDDNSDNYKEDNQTYCINVQKLIDNNYLSEDILSAYDGEDITKNKIKLDKSGKNNYSVVKDCIPTNRIIITFDTNGGSDVDDIYLDEPDQFDQTELPTPIYTDNARTFLGWYKDRDLKQKLDSLDTIDSSITLFAKWGKERLFIIKDGVSLYGFASVEGVTVEDCAYSSVVGCTNVPDKIKQPFLAFTDSKPFVSSTSFDVDLTDYSLFTVEYSIVHTYYNTASQSVDLSYRFGFTSDVSKYTTASYSIKYISGVKSINHLLNSGHRYLLDDKIELDITDATGIGYPYFYFSTVSYAYVHQLYIQNMYIE